MCLAAIDLDAMKTLEPFMPKVTPDPLAAAALEKKLNEFRRPADVRPLIVERTTPRPTKEISDAT